ncbi:di-copper centre-containing protein [Stemphylium lycopersici]|nr:di-copper centre-containing protein [Stemphylium lycopersici]
MVKLNLFVSLALASSAAAAALPAPVSSAKTCTNPIKRYEWKQLSIPQKREYIDAVLCMNKKQAISGINGTVDRFSDFQATHNVQTPDIHWVGHFTLWHRYFIAVYEKALREECGYTGGQPYWDWSLDAEPQNPASTRIFDSEIWQPDTGFGGNGYKVEVTPENNPYNVSGGTGGGCVMNGPFVEGKFTVNYPTPHCLKRDFVPPLINVWADPKNVQHVLDAPDYTAFARRLEGEPSFAPPGNIHGSGHFGVGGALGQAGNAENSPGEPIFYLHHGNIDRVYWDWQQKDLETRLHQVGGPILPFDYSGKNVTLDFEVQLGKLAPTVQLRDLLDTEGGTLCYTC